MEVAVESLMIFVSTHWPLFTYNKVGFKEVVDLTGVG